MKMTQPVNSSTAFDINKNMTEKTLSLLEPSQIILLTLSLKEENERLKQTCQDEIKEAYNERLEILER